MRKQREREGEFRAIVRREKEEFVQSFTCNTKYVYIRNNVSYYFIKIKIIFYIN